MAFASGTAYNYNVEADYIPEGAKPQVLLYPQDASDAAGPVYNASYVEPLLEVVNIQWKSGGRPNRATLRMNLSDWSRDTGNGPAQIYPEFFSDWVRIDDMVVVVLPIWTGQEWLYQYLFIGFVSRSKITIEAKSQSVIFPCVGVDARLDDFVLTGQTVRRPSHDDEIRSGAKNYTTISWIMGRDIPENWTESESYGVHLPVIFNENGMPNATYFYGRLEDPMDSSRFSAFPLFEVPGRTGTNVTAKYWSLKEALLYLIHCYNTQKYVMNPDDAHLDSIFGGTWEPYTRTADCRLMTLREALDTVLKGSPYSWTVTPGGSWVNNSCLLNQLYFFKKGEGFRITLHLDVPGTAVVDSVSDVLRLEAGRNVEQAINDVTVLGDYGYFQSYFYYDSALVGGEKKLKDTDGTYLSHFMEAWDYSKEGAYWDDEDTFQNQAQFHTRHDTTGVDFAGYAEVYREFALNEMGDYSTSPMKFNYGYDEGPFEWDWLFGHDVYTRRRRKFCKCIEKKPNGENYNPMLYISLDGGVSFQPHTGFRIAEDECKLIITTNDLTKIYKETSEGLDTTVNYIDAWWKETLQLCLVASVQDDWRVEGNAGYVAGVAATRHKMRRAVDMTARYKHREMPISSTVNVWGNQIDRRNDDEAAAVAAASIRETLQHGQADCSIKLPGIRSDLSVGQIITEITGRGISLAADKLGRKFPQIVGISYNFEGDQFTQLELDVLRGQA